MSGPRTPLLRPRRYFEQHNGSPPLTHALVVVAVVTLATAGGVAVLLDQFAAALDVTVTVDNPNYPGDSFCESSGFDDTPEGCTQPPEVERRLGALVAEELAWLPMAMLLIVPFWWVFQTAVLHAASAIADGTGPVADTLTVAAWGMVPALLRLVVVLGLTVERLHAVAVPAEPDAALEVLQSALAGLEAVGFLAALLVAVWAGVVRTYGLAEARNLDLSTAALLVGVLTAVGLVFELG